MCVSLKQRTVMPSRTFCSNSSTRNGSHMCVPSVGQYSALI
jgi:hypothetical protein